jgi:predicted anti-sigma-YlaC factor YlaD
MSDHVNEWLNAYLDGELNGRRLHQVEEHLAHCESCQAELESLQGLSALLQQVPAPEFTSNVRFVAQVNLRLPQGQVKATRRNVIEAGWWMIPIGLLTAWIFLSTAILVSDMVSTADSIGVLDSASTFLVSDTSSNEFWSSMLGQIGLLEGTSLQWIELTEDFTRNVVPQFIWQASIALLYLAWIAIWWARHVRQPHGRLLEG